MNKEDHYNKYSTDYLRRYLNGELSDKEMQALEKDALEDPFLADTLEGLEEFGRSKKNFESDILDLNKRLSDRVQKKNRRKNVLFIMNRWQVAAAILILVIISAVTIVLLDRQGINKNIALTNKKDSLETSTPAPPAGETPKMDSPENKIPTPVPEKSSNTRMLRRNTNPEPAKVASGLAAAKPGLAVQPAAQADVVEDKKDFELTESDSENYIQGYVKDDSGRPIPYASVNLVGKNKGVATDTSGYFKLFLEKDKQQQELAVSGAGYNPKKSTITSDTSTLNFKLSESKHMDEVVVTGLGVSKRKAFSVKGAPDKNKNPLPDGWKALYDYINANKKITSGDSVLTGEEVISFTLNKNGKLSSFKTIKSISRSHDAEVIRLLQTGPPLKSVTGKKQKCQISIFF